MIAFSTSGDVGGSPRDKRFPIIARNTLDLSVSGTSLAKLMAYKVSLCFITVKTIVTSEIDLPVSNLSFQPLALQTNEYQEDYKNKL